MIFVLLASLCVLSGGGCGGGKSSLESSNNININEIWNGGWLYESGTAKYSVPDSLIPYGWEFDIQQLAIYLENSDVDKDEGSATMSAFFCLIPGIEIMPAFPLLFDQQSATTTRTGEYEWTLSTNTSVFNIDLNPDTLTANLTGNTYDEFSAMGISFDIVIKKVTTGSTIDVDNALKGAWSVVNEDANGGYIRSNLFGGLAGVKGGYVSTVFNNVDINNKTANMLATASMPASVMMSSGTQSMVLPVIISHDMTLENIFGSIYKFYIDDTTQPTRGIIIFGSEDTATLIMDSVTSNNSIAMTTIFYLGKQSGDDTLTIQELAASSSIWTADLTNYADKTGGILVSMDLYTKIGTPIVPLTMSTTDPFTVNMDVDLANTKATLSTNGNFNVGGISSVNVGDLIKRLNNGSETITLNVQHPGYNTLYAETEQSRFVVVLEDDETAHIFAEIAPNGNKSQEVCSLAGLMKKQ